MRGPNELDNDKPAKRVKINDFVHIHSTTQDKSSICKSED